MIKLSSLLEHILDHPMKGEAIQEAKRLEDNESDPLVCLEFTHEYEDTEGESGLWVIEITRDSDPFDSFGTIEFNDREEAKKALSMLRAACPEHHVSMFYSLNEDTNGNCPTQCVYTPEREHEWVIYNPNLIKGDGWVGVTSHGFDRIINLQHPCVLRFATADEAQEYIDTHQIADAYPWPVPKLSEK